MVTGENFFSMLAQNIQLRSSAAWLPKYCLRSACLSWTRFPDFRIKEDVCYNIVASEGPVYDEGISIQCLLKNWAILYSQKCELNTRLSFLWERSYRSNTALRHSFIYNKIFFSTSRDNRLQAALRDSNPPCPEAICPIEVTLVYGTRFVLLFSL